jgi:hypothetical protein
MRKLSRSLLITNLVALSLSAIAGADDAQRPHYYGLALPYPTEIPELVTTASLPFYRLERIAPMILDIDTKGRVTAVTPQEAADSAFIRYVAVWIKSFRFKPATFRDKKIKSRLPVLLQLHPRVRRPDVYFPIDATGAVRDADLYFSAFTLNGIDPPQVKEFPPYFCNLQWSDSTVIYKFMLVRVELDGSGKVVNTEPVRSTFPAYTMPTMSAILWANFVPAAVQGKPVPSECYLLASFFPYVKYPTRAWRRTELDSLSLLERFRIKLLPDTFGFMAKPLPAWAGGKEFSHPGQHQFLRDTVNVMLAIDSSGHVRLGRMSGGTKQLQAAIREISPHLKFFPALDYQGQCRPYSGLASFIFQGSAKIRIVCHWLWQPDSAFEN